MQIYEFSPDGKTLASAGYDGTVRLWDVAGRSPLGEPLAGGRWSLVGGLADPTTPDGERSLARARILLERYGVVSREAAAVEEVPGGFGPLYRVLRALEEAGRVQRGHFAEGLSGAQFALPGTVDGLRAARPEAGPGTAPALVLSAVDPSNPYGALLPWPEPASPGAPRPRRAPFAQ